MTGRTRILPYVVALLVLSAAAVTSSVATAGPTYVTTPCVPGAVQHRCVFLAPFDAAAAADEAVFRVDVRFGLLNYVAARSTCRPEGPDRDRLGRKGWNRARCDVDLVGETGSGCMIERNGVSRDSAPCTGTIWQLDGDSRSYIGDTHARRARFSVVLLKHPTQCSIVSRIRQVPPFAPRLERP